MIIVLGNVLIQDGRLSEALAVSKAHVLRSREEPGCLEHGVSVDAMNPNRLVFVEQWASMDALQAHFAVPGSRDFVKALTAIAAAPPSMALYEASAMQPSGKGAA